MAKKRALGKTFEIKFYERVVKTTPNFIEALFCLGDAYTKRGLFKKGLEVDLRLAELRPQDPVIHYNLACSYSLLGELDKAYEALKKAILVGFEDFSHLVKDKDLENLRKDIRFNKLMDKLNNRFIKSQYPDKNPSEDMNILPK